MGNLKKANTQPKLTEEQLLEIERNFEEIIRTITGCAEVSVRINDDQSD